MNNFLEILEVNGHGPAISAEPVFCNLEADADDLWAKIDVGGGKTMRYPFRVLTSTNGYRPLGPHLVTWEDGEQKVIQIEQ